MLNQSLKFSTASISLAIISLLASLLLLSWSIPKAQAIVGTVSALCVSTNTGEVSWPSSTGKCPSGANSIKPTSLPTNFKALCLAYVIPAGEDGIYNGVNAAGKISCSQYQEDDKNYGNVVLINRSQVSGTDPYATTKPPGDIYPSEPEPTPIKTGGTGTAKNTTSTSNSKATSGSNSGSSSGTSDSGECPEGFTAKGPLCIPENPFGDSDGIAGKGTIGELATAIISILLGLSGIVAVIMIIIGGYQFMTARGNETQSTNGRKTLVNAIIGLAIIIVSYAVVQAITNYLVNR